MIEYATTSEKRTAAVRPSRIFIGRDGEGCEHHYFTEHEAVVVVAPDGQRARRQPLSAENPIEKWVTFVGKRRGWESQRLYRSFGDAVADRVEVRA